MKKSLMILLLLAAALLTGCGSANNWKVDVTKPLYYQKDKASTFAITITDEKKPVEGLEGTAEFAMKNMDHGEHSVDLKETEKGVYEGTVKLSMAGEWEIVLTLKSGDTSVEKVLIYDVKEPEGVASINGDWITKEDLTFYEFINKLHIAISREVDKENLKGKALEDSTKYWDEQEKINENPNQLLTQIIRLRSIALLGTEKGHKATQEEIDQEIAKIRTEYEKYPVSKQMIQEYGEEKFWETEKKQYELIVLSQKVQQDIIDKVKKENPKVGDQEIMYLAKKQYEELLVSQVNSLKIDIL